MRLQAIHVQGLRRPTGQRRLALDPGYNLLVVPDAETASGLSALLDALLYPEDNLERLPELAEVGSDKPARVGVALALDRGAYRVIADVVGRRLALGAYVPARHAYERVATKPSEVAAALHAEGLPAHDVALGLHRLWLEPPVSEPTANDRAGDAVPPAALPPAAQLQVSPARQAKAPAEAHSEDASEDAARSEELERVRHQIEALEEESRQHQALLEQRSSLRVLAEDSVDRISEFRTALTRREEERARIDHARHELLEERQRLREVPSAQSTWSFLGITLGAASALAGEVFHWLFHVLAAVGATIGVVSLLTARASRRRMGSVEARLAALRVRERTADRQLDTDSSAARSLMISLGLDTVDDLEREVRAYRALLEKAEALRAELERARAALADDAEPELQAGEAEVPPVPLVAPKVGSVERQAPAPVRAPAARELDRLVAAAARWSGRPESELVSAALPRAAPYVRAFTSGAFEQLERDAERGWVIRAHAEGAAVEVDAAPAPRIAAQLALRFALIEALSSQLHAPLLVGPHLPELDAQQRTALARALRRIGSVTQVCQLALESLPWSERASRVLDWTGVGQTSSSSDS